MRVRSTAAYLGCSCAAGMPTQRAHSGGRAEGGDLPHGCNGHDRVRIVRSSAAAAWACAGTEGLIPWAHAVQVCWGEFVRRGAGTSACLRFNVCVVTVSVCFCSRCFGLRSSIRRPVLLLRRAAAGRVSRMRGPSSISIWCARACVCVVECSVLDVVGHYYGRPCQPRGRGWQLSSAHRSSLRRVAFG